MAGLDQDKTTLVRLVATAERTPEIWVGRDIRHDDPGTPSRRRLGRGAGLFEHSAEALPPCSQSQPPLGLKIDPPQHTLKEIPPVLVPCQWRRLHFSDGANPADTRLAELRCKDLNSVRRNRHPRGLQVWTP